MNEVIKRANSSGLDSPPSPHDPNKEAGFSLHIKVLYNARCDRDRYHKPYPAGTDRDLMDCIWRAIPMRGGK